MSAREKETEKLIRELEALRNFLTDDSANIESPVPSDTTAMEPKKPAPKSATVSYLNVKSAPKMSEAMKEELRSQAAPLIQEFIDREMIQLEQQLIDTLNQHLERWMDSYRFTQATETQPTNNYFQSNQ